MMFFIRITQFTFLLALLIFSSGSHAAISFVSSTTDSGNDDRASLTVPGSVVADDVLLVQVTFRDRNGSDGVTTPSGWTLIASQDQDDDVFQSLYYRVASGSDASTSYEWDFDDNGNRRYILGMLVFRGVDTVNPIEAENSQIGSSGSDVTAPSVTTSAANAMLVGFYTLEAGDETFSPASGMTEVYDLEEHNSLGLTSMVSYELIASTGATGDRDATASKSGDDAIGHLVALSESISATTNVGLFTGGDVGEGLDMTGTFTYAVDVAGIGGVTIGDATFTDDAVSGVSTSAQNSIANWYTKNYGSSSNDDALEEIIKSLRWSVYSNTVSMDLTVVSGTDYKLQLLMAEGCCNRQMDIYVEGVLISDDVNPSVLSGGTSVATNGVVITHTFTATDTTLNISIQGDPSHGSDRNPILNAVTLEDTSVATAPLAYYQLEETSWDGTPDEVIDSSGNGHHGRMNNNSTAVTTSPALTGDPGTCGYASQNDGSIEVTGLPLDTSTVGIKTTVTFWMNWDGTNSVMPIGWNIHDIWMVDGEMGFNTGAGDLYGISSAGLASGWHHVAVEFTNGSVTSNRMHIDGVDQVLTQRRGSPNNSRAFVDSELRIGGWSVNTGYDFHGSIDEVRVYESALSTSEINTIMAERHPCGVASLIADYQFDELTWNGTTNEVFDSGPNGYHGAAVNGAITDNTSPAISGDPGTCHYGFFDDAGGSNGDYVELPGFPNLNTDFTMTSWFRSTNRNQAGQRILADDESNSQGFAISVGDPGAGRVRFFSRGVSPVSMDSSAVISNDTWYFVAAVADITNSQRTLYIYDSSGTLINTTTGSYTGTWGIDSGTASIGGETNSGETSNRFSGNIDEVRVYSGALTQAEAAALQFETHACANEPLLEYRFEEASWNGTAGEILDNTGNGHHAQLHNNSTPLTASPALTGDPGTCGYASQNDGSIQVTGLPLDTSRAGVKTTVTFWMNWDGTSNAMPIGWNFHDIWINGGSIGFNTWSNDIYGISSAGLANGWHHIAVEFTNGDVTSNRMHVDGVEQVLTQRRGSPNNSRAFVNSEMRVGGVSNSTSYDFHGLIDEVRVYESALSTSQINTIMAERHACSSVSVDHYAISHSSPGLTCEGALITVTAHDSSHNAVNVSSDTSLTVTTTPAVDSIISSPATILSGTSSTTFYLNQSTALANIDIDVTDGSVTDLDDAGSEDLVFNFLDTAFRFYANGSNIDTTPIGTQISGKPSSTTPGTQTLTLRAVRTNTDTGACEAALTGTSAVNLAYECDDPTSCSASNLLSVTAAETQTITRNNNGAALSYTPVNMTFDGSGIARYSFNFSDAGQVTLHAQKSVAASSPEPAFTLTGSSNAFVTRPFGFDLDFGNAREADWLDNGTLDGSAGDTTYAANSSGSAYVAAGSNFSMQATAVAWESGDDSDNDGNPDTGADLTDNTATLNFGQESSGSALSISHTLNLPSGGANGSLNSSTLTAGGVSTSFLSGVATSTLSWSEVGVIDMSASLQDYLSDTSADISGSALNVGRFYPDHFNVTSSNGSFANACGAFSYVGQGFGYGTAPSLSIIAENSANSTTQNYTETGFLKLVAGNITRSFPSADNTQFGTDGSTLMTVTPTVSAGSLAVGGSAGEMTYTFSGSDSYLYDKNGNAETSPFTSALSIATTAVQDSDSVSAASLPTVNPTGSAIRYGRWNMENVFGPETQSLALSATAQYFNTSGVYVLNSADSCSAISGTVSTSPSGVAGVGTITGIAVGSGTSDLSFNTSLVSGDGQFLFTAPGTGNTGAIDVDVDLSALPWLQYDWDADGSDEDHPGSSATFGQYRGHDRIIYWREMEN